MDGTTRLMKPWLGNWTQTWPGRLDSGEKGLGVPSMHPKGREEGGWDLDSRSLRREGWGPESWVLGKEGTRYLDSSVFEGRQIKIQDAQLNL